MSDQAKKANKFLRNKYPAEGDKDLRMVIVKTYGDQLDLVEEWKKMRSWCTSKNKKASLLRFNNWVKNAIRFREERRGVQLEPDLAALEARTKERLKELMNGN